MRPLLGCFVEIALPHGTPPSAFDAAFARIELIQKLLSFHDVHSDLSRLNRAQGQAVNCHPLSIDCLRLAQAITRLSLGAFNCTLGAILVEENVLPAHNFLSVYGASLINIGDWHDIELTPHNARLLRPVLITLDGIAKGFAVDSAINELKRAGVSTGWINAGGDIRVFGDTILPVIIRDHRGVDEYKGGLQNAAIATSSTQSCAQFPGLLLDGAGHILAAETITVIARKAWRADALTKVAAASAPPVRTQRVAKLGGRWVAPEFDA
jgi:FAD:protein FMN transferase